MSLPGVRSRHLFLLRAALGSGPEVRENWNAWTRRANVQRLDLGSTRLLPLACHNAMAHGVPDHEIPQRISGVARHNWARNQMLIQAARPALRGLREAGLDAMLVKGAAVLLRAYAGDVRLRPLGDVDILVRPSDLKRAVACVEDAGWRRMPPDLDDALHFAHAGGYRLRLHTGALLEAGDRGVEDPSWDRAVPAMLGEERVSVPDSTSLLLHLCVYGLYPPLPLPIRWIADAALLLRARGGEMDWDELHRRARAIGVVPHVAAACAVLSSFATVPRPPPPAVGTGLAEFWLTTRLQRWCGPAPRWWFHARRGKRPFFPYLADMFGLKRASELPGFLARRAVRRWLRVARIRFD